MKPLDFVQRNHLRRLRNWIEFEGKIFNLIQNVKFRKYHNEFQNNLERDLTNIRTDDKLKVAADKTTNFYRLDTPSSNKLLDTAITKAYKKAPSNTTTKIISEEKKITEKLGLDDRIDSLATKNSFITLKDHKPNNNPTCRLINPSKSEIGIISKKILQRINSQILKYTNLNQWKNIDSRNTSRNTTWCKKTTKSLFDFTMGSFDGAETCELVGSYLLSKLAPAYGNCIGLYRDDGLAAFNKTPRETENIKKHICKVITT
jgi:hypothetical protein